MTDPPDASLTDRRGILLMLLSVVLFSANTLIIRGVSTHVSAADGWLASLFRGVCGLVIVAALYGSGRGFNPRRLVGSQLVMVRGVVGAIGILSFYISVTKLGAARAVVLNLTYPAFATIIAALWLKETITRAAILWMGLAFLGLLLFLGGDGKLLHPSHYDLLGLFGAVAAGWVVVVIRRLRHEEHPATIYASQAFYGLLASLPAVVKFPSIHSLASEGLAAAIPVVKFPSLPPLGWVGLIAAATVVCFAQLLMTKAYQALPVSRGSAMQMTLPLVTAVGGFAFYHETFHLPELGGALLTLLATWRVVAAR